MDIDRKDAFVEYLGRKAYGSFVERIGSYTLIHELAESMFPNDAFARDEYENALYAKYGISKLCYRYEGDNHKCLLPKRNELKAPRC